jgi:hypothetical protein
MRRTWFACVVCLSFGLAAWGSTAALARPAGWVAGFASLSAGQQLAAERPGPHRCPARAAAQTLLAPEGGGWILLGQRRIQPRMGQDPAGVAQAFSFHAGTTGEVSSIHVYVDSRNRARRLMVALYSNSGCRPGSPLTAGSMAMQVARARHGAKVHRRGARAAGAWQAVGVPGARITAGRTYWLVVLARGGVFRFRERSSGRCASQSSKRRHLTSLPRSWKPAGTGLTCAISAYASGTRAVFPHHPPACTQTVGSASALNSVVSSAAGGSTICVDPSGGPYGAMTWRGGKARTSAVTVQPKFGTVTFTGQLTEDASWVHLKDVNLAGQVWQIDGPTHDVMMENITAAKFFVYSTASGGVSNLTIKGGSYGPNHVYPDDTIASSDTSNTNTNIVIDGVLFHDQSHSLAGQHFECLQVWAAKGLAIQNSRFTNCSYFDIFIQHVQRSACPACAPTPSDITIQNNWFDCCTDYTTGSNTYYKNYAIMFPSDHGEGTWANVTIRNNSADAPLLLGTNTSDAISYSNFRIEDNAFPRIDQDQGTYTNTIPSGLTASYNAWFQGNRVSAHDIGAVSPTAIFVNWDNGYNADGKQDFHELGGSRTVEAGNPNYFPPTDIDGNTRTSPPDIGASQFVRTP